ncbi:MAG: hypothetical protein ACLQRH_27430, partial [Acidimicrobiales bacterium]
TVGSRYAIYPKGADVSDAKLRIAEAVVIEVGPLRCRAELTAPYRGSVSEDLLKAARAIEIAHIYGGSPLRVFFGPAAMQRDILRGIDVLTVDSVDEGSYDARVDALATGGFRVARMDGGVVATIKDDGGAAQALRNALLGLWRYRFIAELSNRLQTFQVDIGLVPVIPTKYNAQRQVIETRDRNGVPVRAGRYQFKSGDHVMIKLRNRSPKCLFVTVLDLMPDGSIGPVYPHPKAIGKEGPIPADGDWHCLGLPFIFRLGKPYGTEIYKVIATSDPSDFSGLMNPDADEEIEERAVRTFRGVANPLGLLLRSVKSGRWDVGTRGISPVDWATAEVRFAILPDERHSTGTTDSSKAN